MKRYIEKQKYAFLLSVALSFICSLLSILLVYIIQNIVDLVIDGNLTNLRKMILYLLILLVGNFVFGYLSIIQEAIISKRLHIDIKTELFGAFLKQNYIKFRKKSIGTKLSIFENDINLVEEYYYNNVFVVIRSVLILLVGVAYLMSLSIFMGIILLVCAVIILVLPMLMGRGIDTLSENYSKSKGVFISQLKDYCEGMDVIHAYNIEARVKDNYINVLEILENKLLLLRKKLGIYNQAMITGNYLIIVISFSVGGFMVIKNYITVGELIAMIQVMNIIMAPLGELATAFIEIRGSLSIRKKLEDIIVTEDEDEDEEMSMHNHVEVPFNELECKDVYYKVSNSDFALDKISLHLEANKKYVILGPSGCGKTTLLKILANILEATSGEVMINGVSYNLGEEIVSKLISFVQQDTFIFNDTIENNIKLYQEYDQKNFDMAIRITMLQQQIKERIKSECLEGGSNLSGGEKQRIAIARAILRDSPVLLLDEITSALDHVTSNIIEENLFEMNNKTIVFVTHKMDERFLKKADGIFCMEQGKIVEQGTWEDLMNEKGYFYKLYSIK